VHVEQRTRTSPKAAKVRAQSTSKERPKGGLPVVAIRRAAPTFPTALRKLDGVTPIVAGEEANSATELRRLENGKLIFLVVVVNDGSLRQISVDPIEAPSPLRKSICWREK
jgi:hypothetical protein